MSMTVGDEVGAWGKGNEPVIRRMNVPPLIEEEGTLKSASPHNIR